MVAMAQLLVVAIRLLVPLSIFRWPVAGALASMVVDALDVVMVDLFARALGEPGEFGAVYAQLDKVLDTYYLTIELYVAWRWQERMLRGTAAVLYGWRLVGAILFELTALHPLLLVFPNLFENFYLYVAIAKRFATRLVPRTVPQLAIVLVVLLIPKLVQEWVLHWEDAHPWQWLRNEVIRPILGG
jgi:hypothetical protein